MKLSKFNVFFNYEGYKYITNTFTKAIIQIDEEHYCALRGKKPLELIKGSWDTLEKEGIIVSDNLNEIGLLRFAYEQAKYEKDYIEFVVAPTLMCNFKCTYCFETPRRGYMSSEMQEKVFDFFCKKITETKCKGVKFSWYGGEPLLCFDIIEKMSFKIIEFCRTQGVDIAMGIVSNGYLLTKDIVRKMGLCGVNNIQITLDGPQDIHDKRRMLLNGEGTYNRIVQNLNLFNDSDINVSLRINIDKENAATYEMFSESLDALKIPNVHYYPAIVEITQNQSKEQKDVCFSAEQYGVFSLDKARKHYINKGIRALDNKICSCPAEKVNSFVIDELGNVYKCWNSIGYDEDILFNILDEKKYSPTVVSKYMGRDPFSEKPCSNCAYLPVCAGGCVYEKVITGKNLCAVEKYLYREMIISSLLGKK